MKTLQQYAEMNIEGFRQEELILETTELIIRIMNQKSTSKTDLAALLHKTKAYISQCLDGEQNMTLRTLSDIFGALGYRVRVGAEPCAENGRGEAIPRLYPIGGWSFEQSCADEGEMNNCAAAEEVREAPDYMFEEVA